MSSVPKFSVGDLVVVLAYSAETGVDDYEALIEKSKLVGKVCKIELIMAHVWDPYIYEICSEPDNGGWSKFLYFTEKELELVFTI